MVEYRDMATIIRDRIADAVKKGRTLQQVKDSKPVLDYEGRYGANDGLLDDRRVRDGGLQRLEQGGAAAKPADPAKASSRPTPKKT